MARFPFRLQIVVSSATFVFNVVAYGRLDVNVALNRPSYLSSTYTDASGTTSANKANDGDKTNCDGFLAGFSLAATHYELNPWYGVDLRVALQVHSVKITSDAYFGK